MSENTGGLFQSVVINALRKLQGVEVVSPAEKADYQWELTVLCEYVAGQERCDNSNAFSVAYSIRQPLDAVSVTAWWTTAEGFLKKPVVIAEWSKIQSVQDSLFSGARFYSLAVSSGVAHLGRQKYEEFFLEKVRKFDASCLERGRIYQRLLRENKALEIKAAVANLPKDMCDF